MGIVRDAEVRKIKESVSNIIKLRLIMSKMNTIMYMYVLLISCYMS